MPRPLVGARALLGRLTRQALSGAPFLSEKLPVAGRLVRWKWLNGYSDTLVGGIGRHYQYVNPGLAQDNIGDAAQGQPL
ncbi:MAG: hypothetical protein Tsb002_25660 [Wenzhouxiangellaceae bacterium]